MTDTPDLPYPEGAPLRCTRPSAYGTDVVHGVVRPWHNEAGWVVMHPEGGIVAAPGLSSFLGSDAAPAEWEFEHLGDGFDDGPPRVGDRVVYTRPRRENAHSGWDARRQKHSLVVGTLDDREETDYFMQHPDDQVQSLWSAPASNLRVVYRAVYQPVR